MPIENNNKTLRSLIQENLDKFKTNENKIDLCVDLSDTLMDNFTQTKWLTYDDTEDEKIERKALSVRLFELLSNNDPHDPVNVEYVVFYLDKFFSMQRAPSQPLQSTMTITPDSDLDLDLTDKDKSTPASGLADRYKLFPTEPISKDLPISHIHQHIS